jgi:nucleoside-diphosphate-sugar epimerase
VSGSSQGRRALVTGGAGFIGGHLVARLVSDGWKVRVLDDFSTGKPDNLAESIGQVEVLRGDVREPADLARAVEGVEVVFHEAAVPSVPRSISDPWLTHSVNVDGTLRVLEAARHAGVRRVVYAASSSAYGDTEELPKVETMMPHMLSPYALQKHCGEVYCRLYTELYGLETVALRYFNVFGPRQDPESEYAAVIPRFACAALAGEPCHIYGDGEQTRDFTFVADTVQANLLAADAPEASGSVMNVASAKQISLNALWTSICEIVGIEVEPVYEPGRAGDVRDSLADLGRARKLLGFEPEFDLAEGLRLTVESFAGGAETSSAGIARSEAGVRRKGEGFR